MPSPKFKSGTGYICQLKEWKVIRNMKNAIFWDVTPCGSCKNRRFGGTSVLTRATWRNIPEDGILNSHHCGNLKSYQEQLSNLKYCWWSCSLITSNESKGGKSKQIPFRNSLTFLCVEIRFPLLISYNNLNIFTLVIIQEIWKHRQNNVNECAVFHERWDTK
jgi:hypothetical protein